jgi:single-strand DNA-binding protein
MNEITISGNITDEPELRHCRTSGRPVLSFRVAVNDRRYDQSKGRWVDAKPVFHNVVAFNALAENAAETLRRGMAVIVVGKLTNNSWTDDAGANHYRVDLVASNVGVGLMFATAAVTKRARAQTQPAEAEDAAAEPATEPVGEAVAA